MASLSGTIAQILIFYFIYRLIAFIKFIKSELFQTLKSSVMKKNRFSYLLICLLFPFCLTAQIYVSPTGTDSNPGTLASPTTLQKAITTVQAGQTIFMRGGTYNYNATIVIASTNNGTSGSLKTVSAYNGEVPVLDFSGQALADANRGIVLDGDYWYFKGLTIQNAGDNGVLLSGNSNTFDNCIFKGNRDTGLQLSRYSTSNTSISQWPSDNLILNCESYDNKDAASENADGFAAKLTCGTGNIFRGCISHNNADDGWDFYAKTETGPIGAVTLESCVAYGNGTLTNGTSGSNGDRNGFKLGGSGIAVNHIVRRCIAFNNGHHGFTDNDNPGNIELSNNTSWSNDQGNFNFRDGSTSTHRNNVSFEAGESDKTFGTDVGNSNIWWKNSASTNSGALVVSSADFVSLAIPSNLKNSDGSPNLGNFLALASGSDLINAGVTTSGITYTGSAPDIGARESDGTGGGTQYSLTTNVSPSAGGSISRSPNASTYAAGTVVTLTASAASGYTFSNWSGASASTSSTITVTINANTTVTANFSAVAVTTYTLTTAVSPSAGGSVSRNPNATSYAAGTVVTLTATPASGYSFSSYSGSVTGTSSTTTVTMDANKSVTANFTATGSSNTLRIEDAATFTGGFCGFDGSRQNSYTGASGGYYINLSNGSGKGIDYSVSVPAAGTYSILFRYANAGSSSATSAKVLVNGGTAISALSFPKTVNWNTWTNTTSANISLPAGTSTIRLETTVSAEFANIDYFEVTGTGPAAGACQASFAGSSPRTAVSDDKPIAYEFDATVSPNPSKNIIRLKIISPSAEKLELRLTDQNNRLVKAAAQNISRGINYVNIDGSILPPALYMLKIKTGSESRVIKVLME
jgi:uncharacterized repeat protein (TIGR02543 family)